MEILPLVLIEFRRVTFFSPFSSLSSARNELILIIRRKEKN